MRKVGVLEAKTNLSALLDDVEATGEVIVITRHGKPVARLSPERQTEQSHRRLSARELAERARAFRDKQAPDPEWAALSWEELKAIARDEVDR
ncbi:MAG: type II toxin-antitoxin system Phd/YefM family antitoxin [Brevundimonas sp.]|uniref:type II toxin-antitoxin system Phd/YefM family antitoxin n=1 Tax=Brevundimonas sp. TaxID=1871086 RepID=UPI00263041A3|nr:type II toxin-antitoxin system Phd/YefM family antitoxin [Brevundimonas sp.]MDI6623690.1 type II toxin-antitoxin system Phd/YefM family antitoxin [Brevundimonas sp.]MDQ7813338.1 type II toxin-antitoxin system Phd/YefM family antitoxin [Brevundimonas sp.]